MEDFITTEYNFELQKLEKQIDEQKSTTVFGQGEMVATTSRPQRSAEKEKAVEQNRQRRERRKREAERKQQDVPRSKDKKVERRRRPRQTGGY